MLVVEDIHWADDATLDVLGYAARRIETVGAVLVLTCRDDEVEARHPLHRFLGVLAGARSTASRSRRCRARRCGSWPTAPAPTPAPLHRVTAREPLLRHRGAGVAGGRRCRSAWSRPCWPACGGSGAECRDALDQLSVVPAQVDDALAAALLGRGLEALAEAELAGVLEVAPSSLAFRHELARRAIEQSLPAIRRRQLNAEVVARAARQERPERARVMHHAVEAGDVETIVAVGPVAAREAARRRDRTGRRSRTSSPSSRTSSALAPRERAAVLDGYGWELYNAHRFREAVDAGREAVGSTSATGDPVAAGECLVRVSRTCSWPARPTRPRWPPRER